MICSMTKLSRTLLPRTRYNDSRGFPSRHQKLTSWLGGRDPVRRRSLKGSFLPTLRLKDISRAFALYA